MTAVDASVEALAGLDFDPVILCDNHGAHCAVTARWSVRHGCCRGHMGYLCAPCRGEVIVWLAVWGHTKTCNRCGAKATDPLIFDPIKGGQP